MTCCRPPRLPALKTSLHQRQLFASNMIDSRTDCELDPRSTAAEKVTAPWQHITARLRKYRKE